MNQSVLRETIVQTLSHLGSVTVDSVYVRGEEFISIVEIRRSHGDEVRRTEFVTHYGRVFESGEVSLTSGHYFPISQYAEAQADYFERTKGLADLVASNPDKYLG